MQQRCNETLALSSAILPNKKKIVEYWKLLTFKHISPVFLLLTAQPKAHRFDCYYFQEIADGFDRWSFNQKHQQFRHFFSLILLSGSLLYCQYYCPSCLIEIRQADDHYHQQIIRTKYWVGSKEELCLRHLQFAEVFQLQDFLQKHRL